MQIQKLLSRERGNCFKMGIDNMKSRIVELYNGWAIISKYYFPKEHENYDLFAYNQELKKKSYVFGHGCNTYEETINKVKKYIDTQNAIRTNPNYKANIKKNKKLYSLIERKDKLEKKLIKIKKEIENLTDITQFS